MRLPLAAGIIALILGQGCSPEGEDAKAKLVKLEQQVNERLGYLEQMKSVAKAQEKLESRQGGERPPGSLYDEGITPSWSPSAYSCPECRGRGENRKGQCWNCKGTGFSHDPVLEPRPKAGPRRVLDR
jgi:hypothetical protein